jgi:outer membrane PBP1 activator LpoA protein
MESVGKQMMRKGSGTVYRIIVRSELGDRYAVAFEGMEMETKGGDTVLTGEIVDQPHLYGILDRINGLGLELLSVQALPEDVHPSAEVNRDPEESEL